MSSGGWGEEPIDLDLDRRLYYLRLLRLHKCDPRCARCHEARGILIAAGVPIQPDMFQEKAQQTPKRAGWEPVELLIALGLLAFALACVGLTAGRR